MKKIIIIELLILISILSLTGQGSIQGNPDKPSYLVERASSDIIVDGFLDDEAWSDACVMAVVYEYLPGDNIEAPVKTDFLITFDERHLYMAFRCSDPNPPEIRAHLMDRDAINTFVQDDHVNVLIDFFNDERRAFQFRVNPLGVQADAIFSEMDGYEDFSWDAIWESEGRVTESGWLAEMAIPFNQLRFPQTDGPQTWGVSAQRSYPRSARHRIASHKIKRDISSVLSQLNKVRGFQGMKTGLNIEIDPTLVINRTDERPDLTGDDLEKGKAKVDPGVSIRWGITPNMILNATINPDFSQVEADIMQMNVNTRYAIRYPEKRPFFLEGADFFNTPVEAVFTRTVADPNAGIKFTGKIDKNAIGLFGTYDRLNNLMIPSNAGSFYTSVDQEISGGVMRYRRDVGKGSALGVLYTGRSGENYMNHVAGADGFLRLSQKDIVSVNYLRSVTEYPQQIIDDYGQESGQITGGAMLLQYSHNSRLWNYGVSYEDFSPDFRADLGYIPRVDFRETTVELRRDIWGKEGAWYDRISLGAVGRVTYNYDKDRTDDNISMFAMYSGPLQTLFTVIGTLKHELYYGDMYKSKQGVVQLDINPIRGLSISMKTQFGDMVDYSNLRSVRHLILNPAVELNLGKHINMNLTHRYMRMFRDKSEILTANLSQAKLIYNINVKTFIRAIVQYQTIHKNQELYSSAVNEDNKTIFTQFLFSYKLNPQSVLFFGYSDNYLGFDAVAIAQTDRSFFMKMGYAWLW